MWWLIVGAIAVMIIIGIATGIIGSGLWKGGKNVDTLSGCKNYNGICKPSCAASDKDFGSIGCPEDTNGNGIIDDVEKSKNHCCLSN